MPQFQMPVAPPMPQMPQAPQMPPMPQVSAEPQFQMPPPQVQMPPAKAPSSNVLLFAIWGVLLFIAGIVVTMLVLKK
jgi:hypothetical protein